MGGTQRMGLVKAFRLSGVSLAIFSDHGEKGQPKYSTKITKSFKRQGSRDYEETQYYFPSDLLVLERLTRQASDWILARMAEDMNLDDDPSDDGPRPMRSGPVKYNAPAPAASHGKQLRRLPTAEEYDEHEKRLAHPQDLAFDGDDIPF